ncbi:MAG TPA: saccharopine dehydrogenase NADP-binding domain-containing protein [Candidatus Acidoferrales bacterium]|nr:saccharopine dehydrogenase NADP-binding domain-containing protein [Candidatus Acidoferrales bacterium]
MSDPLLLYGATGYTGGLILGEMLRRGLRPLLSGRNEAALASLASKHGLEYRVARLDDAGQLDRALQGVHVTLHAAGPFAETCLPMLGACLRNRVHYLDITGELPVFEMISQRNGDARRNAIMMMPGVGFDVVPSDCLAAHVARLLPGANRLTLAIRGLSTATRGSTKTLIQHAGLDLTMRRNGELVHVAPGSVVRQFNFGDGPEPCVSVPWGDVTAAYFSTGIPNIEVYFDATPMRQALMATSRYFGWLLRLPVWQTWLKTYTEFFPDEPLALEPTVRPMRLIAEVEDAAGRRVRSLLQTPEAYRFTAVVAARIAQRVLAGDFEAGFQTPSRVYGADFVLGFEGVLRQDFPQAHGPGEES